MSSEALATLPSQFGRYTLLERLAMGGMAEVFRAKITSSHGFEKLLVIKRILPHLAADPAFVSMFIDEAKLTAQLAHQKIVQVLDFGDVAGQYFIALELIPGFDALWLLRTAAHKRVLIPEHLVAFVIGEVLEALDYAHTARDDIDNNPLNIVHRDISPSNIFISKRGEVKLGDFGIAIASRRESKTQAGRFKGKFGYMSPEQVANRVVDERSDLFSVGVVMAEMLMGRRLFAADSDLDVLLMVRDVRLERLDKHGAHVHPALDYIVRRALRKDPRERYPRAGEFRDQLTDYLFEAKQRVRPADLRQFVGRLMAAAAEPAQDPPSQGPAPRKRTRRPTMLELASGATTAPANYEGVTVVHDLFLDAGDDEEAWAARGFTSSGAARQTSGVAGFPRQSSFRGRHSDVGRFVSATPDVAPDSAGELGVISTMRLLCDLALGKETGLLRLEAGGGGDDVVKEVFLVGGAPQSVSSNVAGERFGEFLVGRGVILPSDLDLALGILPDYKGRLGDTLVALGLMRPLDVFRWLSRQVRERVIDALRWTAGTFAFYRDVVNPQESFPLGLDPFEILGAGAVSLPADFLDRRFATSLDHRPVMTAHDRIEPEVFRVGPTPREVRQMFDGRRALRTWMADFSDETERLTLLRSLYLLVETDLAQLSI
jgi:eukaryotic-like serine/threonine-protein kinase